MGPIHDLQLERLEDRNTPSISLVGVPGADHAPSPLAFAGFDNPAPGDFHPNFDRSPTAINATMGTPPDASGVGNEGPWSAHYRSPVISCTVEPDCPADPTPYVPHP